MSAIGYCFSSCNKLRFRACSRIVGRYWRHGTWNRHPYFIQEISGQDDNLPLMLIHAHRGEDSKWWIVDPGWGKKQTMYVACGRAGPDDSDHSNLANLWWFVPWDAKLASNAVRCHHGAAWLHDYHSACMASEIEEVNKLLEGAQEKAGGGDETKTNEVVAVGDDDAGTDNVDDPDWRPKAGSLNHKCALIVAIETNDWSRVYHLCRVLLGLVIPLLLACFRCVILVYDFQLCSFTSTCAVFISFAAFLMHALKVQAQQSIGAYDRVTPQGS